MTITRSLSLSLRVVETIEIDDDNHPPSLPPFPVVETTGEEVVTPRPLAKVVALHTKLKRFA